MTEIQTNRFLTILESESFDDVLYTSCDNADDREAYFRVDQQITINSEYDKERKVALGL